MSDQDSPEQKYALTLVGLLIAGIVAAVLALGVWKARQPASGKADTAAAAAPAAAATDNVGRIYFAVGTDALPPEATDVLARVAAAARQSTAATVWVSGFHDASGNVAQNAELAKRRAEAVRHALEANGVAPDRISLEKPAETAGGTDPAEARRVEVHVR